MNLLEQISRHLEFLGLGTVADDERPDGDIFWGRMPGEPVECVCVFSTDSGTPGSTTGARIQIFTRSRSTRKAYERSQAIAQALDEYEGYLAGDGARVLITVENASTGLGSDATKAEVYSSNFRVLYCNF